MRIRYILHHHRHRRPRNLQLKLFVGEYVEHAPAAVRRLIRTFNIALDLLIQRSKIFHIQVLS